MLYTVGLNASADPRFAAKLAFVYGALAEFEPQFREQYTQQSSELSERAVQLAIATGRAKPQTRLAHGVNLLTIGRLPEAIAELEWYVKQVPDDAHGWNALAEARSRQNDTRGAAEALEKAAKLAPIDADTWWQLAQARRAIGDRPRALEAAKRVLLLVPDHAGAKALVAELESSR
jgi:tetratricopeptide (TPR) repeat protein